MRDRLEAYEIPAEGHFYICFKRIKERSVADELETLKEFLLPKNTSIVL